MSSHDHSSLGAYALGVLTPQEATEVEIHLRTCPDGRREVAELVHMRAALDSVPPEAFIDGPPPDGDLLLQRTVRRVRAEEARQPQVRRRLAAIAAAVVIVGGALVGGYVVGQGSGEPPQAAGVPFEATDQSTGASMRVRVEPLAGWVKVHATVAGVNQGEKCELVVIGKDGSRKVAGSWLVTEKARDTGTSLDAPALVDPQDVRSVDVVTVDGRRLVSVPVRL